MKTKKELNEMSLPELRILQEKELQELSRESRRLEKQLKEILAEDIREIKKGL